MNNILAIFFLLCFVTGSSNTLKKHHIYKMFRASIDQDEKNVIKMDVNPWYICNNDSAYYKNDTIEIYENMNADNCCKFIRWTFYQKNMVAQSYDNSCQWPETITASVNDHFKIKLKNDKKGIVFIIYKETDQITPLYTFKVIKIDSINNSFKKKITLQRL